MIVVVQFSPLIFRQLVTALVLGGLISTSGCNGGPKSPKTVAVKGTVIFRDKPLAKARVTFYSKGASINPSAETNEQGQFEIGTKGQGVIPGANMVTVVLAADGAGSPTVMDPTAMLKGTAGSPAKAEVPVVGNSSGPPSANSLPKVYGDAAGTPLNFTISDKGEADLKVEIK
jgi:hypothetical protein